MIGKKFTELEDIQGMILTLETQMEKMCKACAELNWKRCVRRLCVYGRDVEELGFISINADIINSIRERIQQGKQRIKSIKNEKALFQEALLEKQAKESYHAEQNRIQKSKIDEMEKIENLIACAQNLEFDITQRYETLKN